MTGQGAIIACSQAMSDITNVSFTVDMVYRSDSLISDSSVRELPFLSRAHFIGYFLNHAHMIVDLMLIPTVCRMPPFVEA